MEKEKVEGVRDPKEYVWIQRWGNMMGSYRYYIEAEQELAAREGAPIEAIYKGADKWVTVMSINNLDTRKYFMERYSDCPSFWRSVH